ncbi:MoxR family ATPase [Streptacidiphilus sp. P02-A3a]|uniref:AAA family ATPase n=1 Tax=Streptacidiphilus sp. P02-A3a TaxID=2704468 RepID=UPI0015FCA3B0|nr:AAA family ATPase [Streptacidiphilus sp. P02-A3a]QMU72444.1 AAA family ATPase [Streptacidiphilus sp. P02-A3a]
MTDEDRTWELFGDGEAPPTPRKLPPGPPWRRFGRQSLPRAPYVIRQEDAAVVNTALHLRRPLLVTGFPGVGKSSLAHEIARQLGLGEVLVWPVNSRSTLNDALYRYDAVGRLRDVGLATSKRARAGGEAGGQEVGDDAKQAVENYITLGPLGTALAAKPGRPRVLLIDELDKSDLDLPNDLLVAFEDGAFEIPELSRLAVSDDEVAEVGLIGGPQAIDPARGSSDDVRSGQPVPAASRNRGTVVGGWVTCEEFPVIVITSNGERDFPPAFLRRVVRLNLPDPSRDYLRKIVEAQFAGPLADADDTTKRELDELVDRFSAAAQDGNLATDQLLNAIHLRLSQVPLDVNVLSAILSSLDDTEAGGFTLSSTDSSPTAHGHRT